MRVATWNINSVKARHERLLGWLERCRPDVLCLQELKVVDEAFPSLAVKALGYDAVVHGQKTYNGVAILSRTPPEDVHVGLGDDVDDPQARLVSARVSGVHIVSAYFPNGGEVGSDKYAYKLRWMQRLRDYLDRRFDARRDQVLLTGDFNVAPEDDDVARPDAWANGVLTHPEVRDALEHVRAFGLQDTFRPFHPRGGVYTWWDYRGRGFERGDGLRIDHHYATPALAARAIGATVDRRERAPSEDINEGPSDHAPVIVEYE
ncbi:MAG: exodeoxyribonuclease III [Myxococcales bacterium]|nr:exodeoxyribonuclease III [Myxococcales bacterium]